MGEEKDALICERRCVSIRRPEPWVRACLECGFDQVPAIGPGIGSEAGTEAAAFRLHQRTDMVHPGFIGGGGFGFHQIAGEKTSISGRRESISTINNLL